MKKLLFLITFSIMVSSFSNVYAAEPLTTLKGEIDKVFSILSDPKYDNDNIKEQQQREMWEIIKGIFNFNVMSRLTLANNWRAFSPEQQKEFADVFGKFLGKNYLNKIQSEFSNQRVEYISEGMVTDTKAVVITNIIKNNIKTPVNYSMIKQDNSWKIYDVKIEGVSLLKNYRSQFRSILLNKNPDQLIDDLHNKIK